MKFNLLEKIAVGAGVALVFLLMIAGISFVVSILIKVLWNWLMPTIFQLPKITFWQAFGLGVLFKLLLGSVNVKGSSNK